MKNEMKEYFVYVYVDGWEQKPFSRRFVAKSRSEAVEACRAGLGEDEHLFLGLDSVPFVREGEFVEAGKSGKWILLRDPLGWKIVEVDDFSFCGEGCGLLKWRAGGVEFVTASSNVVACRNVG